MRFQLLFMSPSFWGAPPRGPDGSRVQPGALPVGSGRNRLRPCCATSSPLVAGCQETSNGISIPTRKVRRRWGALHSWGLKGGRAASRSMLVMPVGSLWAHVTHPPGSYCCCCCCCCGGILYIPEIIINNVIPLNRFQFFVRRHFGENIIQK